MSRTRWTDPVPVDRAVLEATAHIMGQHSAAARALEDAAAHDGPVRFYLSGNTVIVERLSGSASSREGGETK